MGHLLQRIYRKFFWRTYDNIGRLIAINAIWFAIFVIPTLVCFRLVPFKGAGIAATVLVGLLTHSFAGSGVYALTARLARREEIRVGQFIGEARRFFLRMLALSVIFGAIFFLLYMSINFYVGGTGGGSASVGSTSTAGGGGPASIGSTSGAVSAGPASIGSTSGAVSAGPASVGSTSGAVGHPSSPHLGVLGFFLAGIQIWILAFCILMQIYLMPLLFVRNWGLGKTIKWSAMLVVLRPGLTVLLFLQAFAIGVLLAITGVGIVVLIYCALSLFLNVALLETQKEMDEKWTPKQKPTSWKEIMAEQEKDADERRTLGDILRPWD